jgi:hypothetical protein
MTCILDLQFCSNGLLKEFNFKYGIKIQKQLNTTSKKDITLPFSINFVLTTIHSLSLSTSNEILVGDIVFHKVDRYFEGLDIINKMVQIQSFLKRITENNLKILLLTGSNFASSIYTWGNILSRQ